MSSIRRPRHATLKADADDKEFARRRYWVAQVRDRQGAHELVQPADAELAGVLAKLLDCWEVWHKCAALPDSARNLADGFESGAKALVARLLAHGVKPPQPVVSASPSARPEPATAKGRKAKGE
jgi:hypothetical protein